MHAGDFEELDHTADVGIRARGETLEEMLIAAALGMLQLMFSAIPEKPDEDENAASDEHVITVEGGNAEELLRTWLSELLYRLTVDRTVPVGFDVEECTTQRIRVRVRSVPMDEDVAAAATEIKAVTWHGLRAEHTQDGWTGEVIFDT